MLELLALPDLLLLAILVKLTDQPFAKVFRANKDIHKFINFHKKKFAIRARGDLHLDLFEEQSDGVNPEIEFTFRRYWYQDKNPRTMSLEQYKEDFLEPMSFFRIQNLELGRLLLEGKRSFTSCLLQSEKIKLGWTSEVNEILSIVQPTKIVLFPLSAIHQKNEEIDLEIIQKLNLNDLYFPTFSFFSAAKVHNLMSVCAIASKEVRVNLSTDFYPKLEEDTVEFVTLVLGQGSGKFKLMHLIGVYDISLTLEKQIANCRCHDRHCDNGEDDEEEEDGLKLWTVRKYNGFVLVIQVQKMFGRDVYIFDVDHLKTLEAHEKIFSRGSFNAEHLWKTVMEGDN